MSPQSIALKEAAAAFNIVGFVVVAIFYSSVLALIAIVIAMALSLIKRNGRWLMPTFFRYIFFSVVQLVFLFSLFLWYAFFCRCWDSRDMLVSASPLIILLFIFVAYPLYSIPCFLIAWRKYNEKEDLKALQWSIPIFVATLVIILGLVVGCYA